MSAEVVEPPIFPYQVIETIGDLGMHYSEILNHRPLLDRYGDINVLAGAIHKLIALQMVVTTKTYSPEEGDDFKLTLTKRGLATLRNPDHE